MQINLGRLFKRNSGIGIGANIPPLEKLFAEGSACRDNGRVIYSDNSNLTRNRSIGIFGAVIFTFIIGSVGYIYYNTRNSSNIDVPPSDVKTEAAVNNTKENSATSTSYLSEVKFSTLNTIKTMVLSEEEKKLLAKKGGLEAKLNSPSTSSLSGINKDTEFRLIEAFTVIYTGEFDLNNDGEFETLRVFKYGNGLVEYPNGIKKGLSSFELEQFFVGSVFEKKDINKYFMAPDEKARYRDFISEEQIKALQKKDSNYVSRLRDLGSSIGIYTRTQGEIKGTDYVFEPRFKRLEEIGRF